jgi:hypothetical protein
MIESETPKHAWKSYGLFAKRRGRAGCRKLIREEFLMVKTAKPAVHGPV